MKIQRSIGIVLAILFAVTLAPFIAAKAEQDGSKPVIKKPVFIEITDESGTPKSGATVQITDSAGTVVETVTNADESFTVFLPAGEYTLKITQAPDGFLVPAESKLITIEVTEAEERDDIEADTFPSTSETHKTFCKHNPSHLESYKIFDDGQEITGYCFNQNYDPPTRTPTEAQGDCKYRRLVGTPELLYELSQCKWLGPDGNGFTAQEFYDHIVSIIYHRDYIKDKYGMDVLLADYIVNMAIKQFTDGEMRSFKTTDENGQNLVVREYYPNGPVVYDENGYYQFREGGSVLGSIVGHANSANSGNPDYVFPQYFRDAWAELLTMTDHPDDYYLYIYYPHNFMSKEDGLASGWHTPSHYDPLWYYYADAFQCLLSGFTVPPVRVMLTLRTKTEIEITKTWADEGDQDGYRPSAAEYTRMVKLYADGTDVTDTYMNHRTVTDNGDETYTVKFTDLPKFDGEQEIAYTIRETNVPQYTPDKTEVTTGGVITNRHDTETVDIPVTKKWQDGNNADGVRPDSITVHLLADGTEVKSATVIPDENGDWEYTFEDLPKFKDHGTEIVYTITEDPVPEYESEIENYTITNTHEPETTEITVTKEWRDEENVDGVRPEIITVHLFADDTKVKSARIVPNENGIWSYTFENLPKNKENGVAIVYSVTEDPVPEYEAEIENFTITNTHEPILTEITVTKEWQDAQNQDGVRPASITVRLLADGTEIKNATVVPDEHGDWTYTFTNLRKFRDKGVEIVYTITEDPVPEYESEIENYTITNKHEPEKTVAEGKKTWDDDDNKHKKRPVEITIRLLADGVEVDSKTVTEADGWKWTFTDLPKYKDGKEIKYTVKEDHVAGYTATVNGMDITNVYEVSTGDDENPWIWVSVFAASLLAAFILLVLEWKYRKHA